MVFQHTKVPVPRDAEKFRQVGAWYLEFDPPEGEDLVSFSGTNSVFVTAQVTNDCNGEEILVVISDGYPVFVQPRASYENPAGFGDTHPATAPMYEPFSYGTRAGTLFRWATDGDGDGRGFTSFLDEVAAEAGWRST